MELVPVPVHAASTSSPCSYVLLLCNVKSEILFQTKSLPSVNSGKPVTGRSLFTVYDLVWNLLRILSTLDIIMATFRQDTMKTHKTGLEKLIIAPILMASVTTKMMESFLTLQLLTCPNIEWIQTQKAPKLIQI